MTPLMPPPARLPAVLPVSFAAQVQGARRLLLCNPAPLGDALHGLLAMRAIAAQCPEARIDVLSVAGSAPLFETIAGVDRVFAVQWHPRLADRRLMRRTRRQALKAVWQTRYDAVIDLKPSDRSIPFVLAARAPLRLGVRCFSYGLAYRWLYTHLADQPWLNQSLYRYQLDLLATAGFDAGGVQAGQQPFVDAPAPQGLTGCIHLSFCTTSRARELPPEVSRQLLAMLCERHPDRVFAVSCSANAGERQRLMAIIEGLPHPNLKVFAGSFSIAQLAALLHHARLHVGPDTGSLHLAWLQGTPTVSWFLNHEHLLAWSPRGARHRVLVSALEQCRDASGLYGIAAARIADAVDAALARSPQPAPGEADDSDTLNYLFCSDRPGLPLICNA